MPGNRFSGIFLNNLNIENYTVVIPENATSFEKWTAEILCKSIEELCGTSLETVKDSEKETHFFDVVAWRSTAEFICKYFTKGRMIVLDGRFQNRERTNKEGQKWTANELVVDNAYFGDSKPAESGSAYGGDDAQYAPAYGGQYAGGFGAYNGPVAGAVPDGYCPDF